MFRVAAAYAVVGWLLIQVATQVFPFFDLPNWSVRLIVLAIVAGFPIAIVLAWAFEMTPDGVRRTEPADSPVARAPDHGRRIGRHLNAVIIAVLALAVAVLLWRQLGRHTPDAAAAKIDAQDRSIAVLPFENLSTDPSNAYFADGIQDEILTGLANVGQLKVISRTSTQRYASKPDNIPEIARQLGVANILEGSVQKSGNRVRVNVQLIAAASDSHLWAKTYDRTLDDVFAVQSRVAEEIAASLKAQLTHSELEALAEKPTDHPEAYDAYLRARHLAALGYDLSSSRAGALQLKRAVELDPDFALAWARLAEVESYLYLNGVDPDVYTADSIKQAADTAIRLRPEMTAAELAQGFYRYRVLRDFSGAERQFEAVLAKKPNDALATQYLGLVERRQGKWTSALAHLEQASELDPRNPGLLTTIGGETLPNMRRLDEGRQWLDRALAIAPESTLAIAYKAQSFVAEGRFDEATQVFAQSPELGNDPQIAWVRSYQHLLQHRYDVAIAELRPIVAQPLESLNGWGPWLAINLGDAERFNGDDEAARATYEQLIEALGPRAADRVDDSLQPVSLALSYAGVGDSKRALAQAQHAVDLYREDANWLPTVEAALARVQTMAGDHDDAIAALARQLKMPGGLTRQQIEFEPYWDPLRKDSAFQALLADAAPEPH